MHCHCKYSLKPSKYAEIVTVFEIKVVSPMKAYKSNVILENNVQSILHG